MEIDKVRFWIGTSEVRRSSVWSIWGHHGQVYLLSQSMAGNVKLSVHTEKADDPKALNVCQFGFESRERSDPANWTSFADDVNPLRWKRRKAREGESHEIARVLFPTDYLRMETGVPQRKSKKFQCYLDAAPSGRCVMIRLISIPRSVEPDSGFHVEPPGKWIARMPLGESETCLVVAQHADFDSGFLPIGKPIHLPVGFQAQQLGELKSVADTKEYSAAFWNTPSDFDYLTIAETTGLNMTINQ